jgi:hypothetical protein
VRGKPVNISGNVGVLCLGGIKLVLTLIMGS